MDLRCVTPSIGGELERIDLTEVLDDTTAAELGVGRASHEAAPAGVPA